MQRYKAKIRSGEVMIFFMGLMTLTLFLVVASLSYQVHVMRNAKELSIKQDATYIAEAGLEKGLAAFIANASYTGETLAIGNGTTVISLSAGSGANEKILTSAATVDGRTRRLRVKLSPQQGGVAVAFRYALQAGDQGINMGNGSVINGNLYSNQNITAGNGGASVTGSALAVGTISNSLTVTDQRLTGQPAQPLATFDANFWRTRAQAGTTITGDYTPGNNESIGPLYVNGKLTFSNNSNVTIKGPIYASGTIAFGNNLNLTIDTSTGNLGILVAADGAISFGNSLNVIRPNGQGYILVTSTSTSSSAISIGNGTTVVNAPLFAPNGGITIGNSAHALSFAGRQVTLGTNAVVTYDEGLASASYVSGPSGTWVIQRGSYQEY